MRRASFCCFGGSGRRLVRSAPCMDLGTLRRPRLLLRLRPLLRPPLLPLLPLLLLPLWLPPLPPRPRPRPPREPRERERRLPSSEFESFELPDSFAVLPEAAASFGAWKTGEAASFEAVSVSEGGPALRVTLRERLRGSVILKGLQPSPNRGGGPRPHPRLPRIRGGEDLLLQCPAGAGLP